MNQAKIGKLIAECRKAKKLTQVELAEKLGVSDKSISKWENGVCLPDVSLYKNLCEILGITLNEFFSGERLSDDMFKAVADNNLLNVLENSVFTIKDRIDFFKKKWEREHFIELMLTMVLIVFFIIYGFIKDNGLQYLFIIIGFISGIVENNRMISYIEKHIYIKSNNISVEEFKTSIKKLAELNSIISEFENKKDAINYLMQETGLSKNDCTEVYNLAMKNDFRKVK